jgi:preprotein translocase subunit SecE
VARERKRVKRGSGVPAGGSVDAGGSGLLGHGEVDEFDAALVRGAEEAGEPALEDAKAPTLAPGETVEEHYEGMGLAERVERAVTPPRSSSPGNRAMNFLRASWAELQRVQWPDREQVAQATAVVLGFVAVAGLYLGLADWLAQKVVNAILS